MSFTLTLYKDEATVKKIQKGIPVEIDVDYSFTVVNNRRILDVIAGRLGIEKQKAVKLNEKKKNELLEILNTCGYWNDAEIIIGMCKRFSYQYIFLE